MRPKPAAGLTACGLFLYLSLPQVDTGNQIWKLIQCTHETTATTDEKPEREQHCAHFRDEVKMN
ncbi:hypothetical protein CRU79_06540 [Escherichia sp. E4385]|nr:hypothetical protein CRU79_06540 [Escherichia sp. E4385]